MQYLDFYKKAIRIRMIEEAIAEKYPLGEMRCPVHLSIGQESNAVAIADCLTADDYMVSTHRSHAHYLAKGGSLDGLLGELYGKKTGCSGGNGGSMHLVDTSCGFLGSTSIVGGTIPIGVGAAFAAKLKNENRLTVVCIGDAAIEEGVFHESANFAALHKLPVIFFMENNNYSCFTPLRNRQPEREHSGGFRYVAEAHGMKYVKVSWTGFFDECLDLETILNYMRETKGYGPLFVECEAYRFVEHCGPNEDDNLNYRPPHEIKNFKGLDIIKQLESQLSGPVIKNIKGKLSCEINSAFRRAQNAPLPKKEDLGAYLYA